VNTFGGMTIVFTGTRNKEWEARIESSGGKVSTSVSKNTSFVVAKDPNEDSGKIKKARDAGVRIISIDEFRDEFHM
jgi:DNA ligase (NAD+)